MPPGIQRRPVPVEWLVGRASHSAEGELDAGTIDCLIAPGLPMVDVDPAWVGHALRIMVEHARRHLDLAYACVPLVGPVGGEGRRVVDISAKDVAIAETGIEAAHHLIEDTVDFGGRRGPVIRIVSVVAHLCGQRLRLGERCAYAGKRGISGVQLIGGALGPALDGGYLRLVELVPDQQAGRLRIITRRLDAQTARQFALGLGDLGQRTVRSVSGLLVDHSFGDAHEFLL